jgi:hypothetical protein
MALIGLLPGIPILPFGLLAGGRGWLAYSSTGRTRPRR